jgi:hypothetical protein
MRSNSTQDTEPGRPVPIHASGSGVVTDCVMCGLPYSWHDQSPDNWLACPSRERLTEIESQLENELVKISEALKAKAQQ